MLRHCRVLLVLLVALGSLQMAVRTAKGESYFPDATWQHKAPSETGLDPGLLNEAIAFAIAAETKAPRDQVKDHYEVFGREPFSDVIGPVKDRGDPTGLIVRHGYIVAQWGDPGRVDMVHSVTKSFLSSVVGLAVDRGMIRSIDDAVRDYMAPIQAYSPFPPANGSDALVTPGLLAPFESQHNRTITWDNLLRQTSDWEGPYGASRTGPIGRSRWRRSG